MILSRIGENHGDYKIVSVESLESNPEYLIRCTECGAEKRISATTFEKRINFHCSKHYIQQVKFDESYIGRKNNFLTVKAVTRFPKSRHRAFLCECECGNMTVVEPTFWENGAIKSCGCKYAELRKEASTIHGHSGDRLYRVYNGMKQRCYNPSNPNYHNYGGRGIRVCKEWLDDFMSFYNWAMANGYNYNAKFSDYTLDRINVNGNYEPNNCRWVNAKVQASNKRPSSEWKRKGKKYNYKGKLYYFSELCEMFGTSYTKIRYRMDKLGMTLEQALNTPNLPSRPYRK